MYNFDPYSVLLSIATNIPVLLMTAFVLQGHIFIYMYLSFDVTVQYGFGTAGGGGLNIKLIFLIFI